MFISVLKSSFKVLVAYLPSLVWTAGMANIKKTIRNNSSIIPRIFPIILSAFLIELKLIYERNLLTFVYTIR